MALDAKDTAIGIAKLSWAAGIFEGEGTVTITRSGKRGVTRPLVMLTSTDRSIIDELQSRWPGNIRTYTPKGNARMAHCWTLNVRSRIARFLFDIEPFIRTKRVRQKIWLVLEDIGARVQGRPKNPDYLVECHIRRERVRTLNKRGTK